MNKWEPPITEYRGEFAWNFKEGFSREGRRLKTDDRLSCDVRQLRLLKRKELAEEELARAREAAQQSKDHEKAVVVDRHGDEYEVCETAKEAIERLIKSDPRLASKYQSHIKKMNDKLKPYGTSYDNSFMKSTNVFPTVKAYELAAEEFERNQDVFEGRLKNRAQQIKNASMKNEWTSKRVHFEKPSQDESLSREISSFDHDVTLASRSEDSGHENRHSNGSGTSDSDRGSLRQRWVEKAHQELSNKFSANPKTTEDQRKRESCEVPLWFRRGLERKGLV